MALRPCKLRRTSRYSKYKQKKRGKKSGAESGSLHKTLHKNKNAENKKEEPVLPSPLNNL